MSINPAGTPAIPDFETDTATEYKTNIDNSLRAHTRLAGPFAPHEYYEGSPAALGMKVQVDAGHLFDGTTLTEVAAQQTADFTAPSGGNSRIDRIVGSLADGTISVVAGTAGASPVSAPAIPAGYFPIAQVHLETGQTSITNLDITDERAIPQAPSGPFDEQTVETYDPSTSPATEGTTKFRKRVINIGVWNMDATTEVQIPHGLTASKIRRVTAQIVADSLSTWYQFSGFQSTSSAGWGARVNAWNATHVILDREVSGPFDATGFDDTGINRGFIVIEYDPN